MAAGIRFLIFAGITVLCVAFYPSLTPGHITAFIRSNGAFAPALFITVCALRPVLFFLPSMGLTILAGALFGTLWGTVYVVVGGAFSTAVGYYFARWLGRDSVSALVRKSRLLRKIEKESMSKGRNAVLYMRLFNVPWDIVSYWAGLSGISFKDFYVASLIPLVPVSFLYTYFGSTVFAPASAGFIISLTIIIIMGAVPFLKGRWVRK